MKTVYFVSSSREKHEEIESLGKKDGIKIDFCDIEIKELQTEDVDTLIKYKAKKAYQELRRPVLVEHTALGIDAFKGLPALQTSYFYKRMDCEAIVEYCSYKENFTAYAESILCFCDGKEYKIGKGMDKGTIVNCLSDIKGTSGFGWDKIFVPDEDNPDKITYASDLSKKQIRAKAWNGLCKQIKWSECLEDTLDKEKEQKYIEELAELIKQKKVMLFIGAGISASLNNKKEEDNKIDGDKEKKGKPIFPTWSQLINQLGKTTGYDEELFSMHGDNMMLAEYVSLKGTESLYQILRDNFDIEGKDEVISKLKESKIYENICALDCPIIYTTNYDGLIEKALEINGKNYSKVSGIEDMQKIKPDTTRIMKFHGDVGDEESIVLAESKYFKRMDFDSFMDIQFQADILQYHVLFLGYSMSDINIKLLLYLAKKRWTDKGEALKAYIYTATPNEIQKQVFESNNIYTISRDEPDKKEGTLKFLEKLNGLVTPR